MEKKGKTPAEVYLQLFSSLLKKQIDGEISDFEVTNFEKELVGEDEDGTKVYNAYAECKIVLKKSAKFIEVKMTILKMGTEFEDFDFEYDSIKYRGEDSFLGLI